MIYYCRSKDKKFRERVLNYSCQQWPQPLRVHLISSVNTYPYIWLGSEYHPIILSRTKPSRKMSLPLTKEEFETLLKMNAL